MNGEDVSRARSILLLKQELMHSARSPLAQSSAVTEKFVTHRKSDTIWSVLLKDPKTPKLIRLLVAAELCLVPLTIVLFTLSPWISRVFDASGLAGDKISEAYFLGSHFRFLAGVLANRFNSVDIILFELLAWLSICVLLLRFFGELVFFSQVNTGAVLTRQRQAPGLFFAGWVVTGPGPIVVIVFLNQEATRVMAGFLTSSPRAFLAFQECLLILAGMFCVEGLLLFLRILFFDDPTESR